MGRNPEVDDQLKQSQLLITCKYGKHPTHPHEVVPLVQVMVEIVVLH